MLPGKVVAQTENAGVYAYIESGTGDYNGKYILKFTNYAIEGGTQIDISTKEAPSLSAYRSSLVKVSFRIARIEAGGAITSADKAVYNLAGQRVGNDYKGIVIIGGKKILRW